MFTDRPPEPADEAAGRASDRLSRLLACLLAACVLGCQGAPVGERLAAGAPAVSPRTGAGAPAQPETAVPLPPAKAGDGYVALRIHWPRRTQAIPLSAEFIVVNIYDPLGVTVVPATRVVRPARDNDVISHVAIALPAARHLTIWARAYRKTSATILEANPQEVPVAVGSATDVDVFDNVITPVSIRMKYIPIQVYSISPDNGGEGAEVTLTGVGFNGFVDPLHPLADFQVRFTHQTVYEGNVGTSPSFPYFPAPSPSSTLASPSAGTDLWIAAVNPTRESDTVVRAVVPEGAVNGPVDYQVDGVSAAPPSKTFRVLKSVRIVKNEGPGTGPDHAAYGPVYLEVGDVQLFYARAFDSLGAEHRSPAVSWTSSLPGVGVVSGGVFAARRPGRTQVAIASGKATDGVEVVVLNPSGTASIDVPLPNQGTDAKVEIWLPPFDQGEVTGVASP